jgi:hypothetical protein
LGQGLRTRGGSLGPKPARPGAVGGAGRGRFRFARIARATACRARRGLLVHGEGRLTPGRQEAVIPPAC